ncbi:MAG: Secretion system C-terminal sorting domain [Bacteroidota bacterium]|jgi:hypothetical protein|nr:Secretion system C-terminal sorting domain [Bacteroidota bacterium]
MGCAPSGSGYFNSVPPNGTVKVWPPVYCKTNDTNWESGIIGLNELQNKNVSMYPNPVTSGLLQIRTGTNTEANIFSVSGDRILTQQFEQETEISLEFLSSGVYTLELMTDQNVWRKKFIKLP